MNELRSLLERGDGISDERFNRKTGEAEIGPAIPALVYLSTHRSTRLTTANAVEINRRE